MNKSTHSFSLYILTCPNFFPEEAKQIIQLMKELPCTLHIRKPKSTIQEMEEFLKAFPISLYKYIVLHDHHELALKYPLKGIHLNQRHPLPPSHYKGSLSRSCHSLNEVMHYKDAYDYIFLSPIFDSISKKGYTSNFSLSTLQEATDAGFIDEKVIALGGIQFKHFSLLKELGFGGAALLGEIWKK